MHDPTIHSSSFDLTPGGATRVVRWVVGLVVLGALIVGGYIVFKLATEDRAGVACDHFDRLAAKESAEHKAELVSYIERRVEASVVQYGVVRTERVEVTGCRDAVATLEKAMGNRAFTNLTKCMETAKTARSAARCF